MPANRRSLTFVLAVAAACGCAAAAPAPPSATRYRLGDYVVYRYAGPALAEPVTLREEVVAQEGLRLRIDVTATRPSGERAWVQVLTDTPKNQRDNVVDALWEKVDGRYVKLANRKNRDVYRLYDWALFKPDKPSRDIGSEPCKAEIAGAIFHCTCSYGMTTFKGTSVRVKETECPDFLWTHGPSDVWPEVGEPVFFVDVVETGRREDATGQPFEP
jgi:hypothetical protein